LPAAALNENAGRTLPLLDIDHTDIEADPVPEFDKLPEIGFSAPACFAAHITGVNRFPTKAPSMISLPTN
jgi:hypothetical protein